MIITFQNLARLALALFIAAVSTIDGAQLYVAGTHGSTENSQTDASQGPRGRAQSRDTSTREDAPASEGEQSVDLGAPPVFLLDQACKPLASTQFKLSIRFDAHAFDCLRVDHHLPYWRPRDTATPHDAPPSRLGTSPHLAHGPPTSQLDVLCVSNVA